MTDLIAALLADLFTLEMAWIATWLLPMRRPVLFWCLMVASVPFARVVSAWGHPYVNLVFYLLNYAVIPYMCWKGRRAWRLVLAVGLVLVEVVIEMESMLFAMAVGHIDMSAARLDPSITIPMRIVGNVVVLMLGLGLRALARRVTGEDPGSQMARLAPVLVVQMLVPAYFVMMYTTILDLGEGRAAATFVLVMVCCSAASLIVVALLIRNAAVERERLRAQELAAALDSCLEGVQSQLRALEADARLRHDRRNHLQVVEGLVARGELTEAGRYIDALLEAERAPGEGECP